MVLEATVFPGINLFWIGTIMMLAGLLIAMGFRIAEKRKLIPAYELKVDTSNQVASPNLTSRPEPVG